MSTFSISKKLTGAGYLTPGTRKAFKYLQHAFTLALIFQHFNPKCSIQIQTIMLGPAICRVLSQVTLNKLG